nr:secreted RxLR effector protein 124-like [Hydra vulgaris]
MENEMQELQKDYSSLFNSLGNNCKQLEKYKNRIEILKNKEERDILIKYEYKVKGFNIICNKVDFAESIGKLDLIKLLNQLGYRGTELAIDSAAENGHLEVIKYLHELGTNDAINNAAENGHLEVVKYLHEKGYRCLNWVFDYAAKNGHLEVVKYLHELGYKGSKWAIDNVAHKGHLEVVKYLHEKGYKNIRNKKQENNVTSF